jgi:hypothetical protein
MTKRDRANIARYVKTPKRFSKDELEIFAWGFRMIDRLASRAKTTTPKRK